MAEIDIEVLPRTRKEAKATGAKQYFTGKCCKQGHVFARGTINGACVECKRLFDRERHALDPEKRNSAKRRRRAENPEKVRAASHAQWAKNLEKSRADDRARRLKNRDHINARKRELRRANIDISRAKSRAERAANVENCRLRGLAWKKANPEKNAAHSRNRHARKMRADGSHTEVDIARIREAQRDRCAMPDCRVKLKGGGHVDHIKPLKRGGSNSPRNLQLLCVSCNTSKHARDPIEFAQSRGLLL